MELRMNVIAVMDKSKQRLLMCKRSKNPYKGLMNLVGGKIEEGEQGILAAYRELMEETSITSNDIELIQLMNFSYRTWEIELEVYFGWLNKEINVYGEENELKWININENFFDVTKFVGEGNIGHIVEHIKMYQAKINNGI